MIWEYSIGNNIIIIAPPIIDSYGNSYYFLTNLNTTMLYSINTLGTLNWTYNINGVVSQSPAIDLSGNIYFTSTNNINSTIYSITSNNEPIWNRDISNNISKSSILIDNNGNIINSFTFSMNTSIYSFDKLNGNENWHRDVSGDSFVSSGNTSSLSLDNSNNIYFATYFLDSCSNSINSRLYYIRDANPNIISHIDLSGSIMSSTTLDSNGNLFINSYNKYNNSSIYPRQMNFSFNSIFYSINTSDLSINWEYNSLVSYGNPTINIPPVIGTNVSTCFCGYDGKLYIFK